MLHVLLGLVAAALFGIGAYTVYGLDGLMERTWIESVFWSLIAAGAIVQLVGREVRCKLCALGARFDSSPILCQSSPCLHA